MLAWHFLSKDKRLGYDDGRLVEVGVPLECEGDPELCSNGMHGSVRLIDAAYYASGPIVCRVEIEGDVIEGDDKLCGRRRTVLWMLDATKILHEFACSCAEDALALVAQPDPRSVAAIEAKRKWLMGEITDEELDAAEDAAWAAVRDAATWAARAAARSASRAASLAAAGAAVGDAALAVARAASLAAAEAARAAEDASRAASRDAAWAARAAARSASRAAARDVAWAVAWSAARDAARDGEWAKQNERLTAMVMAEHEKEGK